MYQKTTFAVITVAALLLPACGWLGGAGVELPNPDIVTGSFSVGARNFTPFTIEIPEGLDDVRIEGTFSAEGGRGNDVEVILLEEIQFRNWQNRHKFLPMYESGRVSADQINVPLPGAGRYVMVFSNRFSLLSTKAVTADLKLRYDD
jgi:hypothetical protein